MKVLFYVRANHDEIRGGDLVQLESTAAALRRLGVTVDYSSDAKADLSSYDLVHIFNSPRFQECLDFMANAKHQQKPVAFSTIFWPKDELGVGIADSPKVKLAKKLIGANASTAMWRLLKKGAAKQPGSIENMELRLFQGADVLLPNSEGEMRAIHKTYGVQRPYQPVRNAIESSAYEKEPSLKRDNFVLSVGRIESRKNTLALIEACHEAGLHLVLIGGVEDGKPYNEACLAKIKEYEFEYLGLMPAAQIIPYYYRARIHAMASWYETPGLSSMEAACGGATIVSTDRGSTTEYFGNMAYYCNPFSRHSIRAALEQAQAAEPSLRLRDKIRAEYTWDLAAEDTLAGYRKIADEKA
jgi:glycosyltransferase involved in cell wall biosynthesis